MKTLLLSLLFLTILTPPSAQAFWGEQRLVNFLEKELDQKLQLGTDLARDLQESGETNQDAWILSTIRVLAYPMLGVKLGIINLQVKPLVEIRWIRKARPELLKPY